MNSNDLQNKTFNNALKDYFYLIDRNYPEKGSLKLVGDHYKLEKDFRSILYRGISSKNNSKKRTSRLTTNINSETLIIDGYNVLFTLLNYRLGRFVFISNDNICRDAGSLHGKLRNENLFMDCAFILLNFLKEKNAGFLHFFFDSPVSHSNKHKEWTEQKLEEFKLAGKCEIERSPDYHIKKIKNGIIATSDTAIIDATTNQIADIPRMILEKKYRAKLFDIYDLFSD